MILPSFEVLFVSPFFSLNSALFPVLLVVAEGGFEG